MLLFDFFFYKNTVDEEEVEKLSRPTSDWWNPNGEFAALHSMNKLRISFIKKSLDHQHTQNISPSKPLRGFRILDVGCGGGILSEVRHISDWSRTKKLFLCYSPCECLKISIKMSRKVHCKCIKIKIVHSSLDVTYQT